MPSCRGARGRRRSFTRGRKVARIGAGSPPGEHIEAPPVCPPGVSPLLPLLPVCGPFCPSLKLAEHGPHPSQRVNNEQSTLSVESGAEATTVVVSG